MLSFREFMQNPSGRPQASVGGLPFAGGDVGPAWERTSKKGKPWKAKRADVVEFWKRLKPSLPLQVEPIDPRHRGTRFHEDGLRITGSPEFINSILSRIKDFLQYEINPGTKLDIEYRQIETKEGDLYNKPVFVAYVHVVQNVGRRSEAEFEKPKEIKLAKPV